MASVLPYGDGQFRVQVSVTRRGLPALRDSATFSSKREATQWGARRQTELAAQAKAEGLGNFGSGKTLADAFRRYGDEVSQLKRGCRWELLRLLQFARHLPMLLPLDKITEAHLASFRDARNAEVSAGTVLREFKLLSNVFEVARRDWRWCSTNPTTNVRKPKQPKHRSRLIGSSEIKALCRQLGYRAGQPPGNTSQALALCFLLALRTGMRSGEITGLDWARVHSHHVHLDQTKTDNPRDVPLSHRARQIIGLMRGRDSASVFTLGAGTRDTLFRKARTAAGLAGFTFHDARHNAATRIGKQVGRPGKLSVFEFCAMFGWRKLDFAMVYVNPSAADVAGRL